MGRGLGQQKRKDICRVQAEEFAIDFSTGETKQTNVE